MSDPSSTAKVSCRAPAADAAALSNLKERGISYRDSPHPATYGAAWHPRDRSLDGNRNGHIGAEQLGGLAGMSNGTRERFQRDIMRLRDAAERLARFLSRDADVAEDIVQEAFLQAYRGFQGYQGGDPRAWIFTIVRNCHRKWLRQRRRKMRLEIERASSPDEDWVENVASDADTPEVTLLRQAESTAVQLVLNDMPRAMREMLVLRELEGLSYREIADIAALPIGTVMSRLARARAHFQAAWRQQSEKLE